MRKVGFLGATLALLAFALNPGGAAPVQAATCTVPSGPHPTIQAGVNDVTCSLISVSAGSYPENVVINRPLTLEGAGAGSTTITGGNPALAGIRLSVSLTGVTIKKLTVTGYLDDIQMFTGPLNNILIEDVHSSNNTRHGIWSQAFSLNNLTLRRVNASSNNAVGGLSGRGFWAINGVKTGITVEDGTFNNNGLVGIDISDGSVTGLAITGNTVVGNGDSGIGVLGATGPGANLVANNTVTNNGRFGIEVKNPNGNGSASGPGSIVVRNNVVSRTIAATDARDYAGIAVFRRFPVAPNADQPSGVVVEGNTVSGFVRKPSGSTGDGFGIVVEGLNQTVRQNTVSGNNIGIQMQAGNAPPPPDIQSTSYFDRGSAQAAGGVITRNNITGNTDFGVRNVGVVPGPVNATCNWWGAASGPGPVGPGSGDRVSAGVAYQPWLIAPAPGGLCLGGNVPTNKDDCKQNGWMTLVRADGSTFKNQGDCIQYVNTGK